MAGDSAYFYRTENGSGLPHDPFNAIVAPRPIGWISSVSADGTRNLAPYSFFNGFNYRPPLVGFASIGWKDSVANISETKNFVWNLATRPLADAMNETSASVPSGDDEFVRGGLTPVPSTVVAAPRVLESPVNFECVLTQLIRLTDVDGQELDTWMVFGQVVAVHIEPHLLNDGVYDTAAGAPIMRGGGLGDYAAISPDSMFRMIRPDDRKS